ncbi:EamA family transporter RarD [Telmatospirillum sp. J64-1]|uniref:EamA family transporter RarD n=1 Tax=Telmatospirillum sp. J64-1 TaxID=2502183 RepID=UPI00115E66C3|nr:EamA family transporter RarD [Telmatospirillum sp. J64-1]
MFRQSSALSNPVAIGVLAAGCAYLIWGVSGLYFKALSHISPLEVLCHRTLWTLVLTGLALAARGELAAALKAMSGSRRLLGLLVLSSALIGINWVLFIWSIISGHALEASMGYFLYPLAVVVLARLFLGEKMNPRQMVALAVVMVGVTYMMAMHGRLPWVALTLAVTFAFYGLMRKTAPVESLSGLFLETVILAPLALAYLAWIGGGAFLEGDLSTILMLMLAGPVTGVPLLLFAFGARRLRLSTVGLMMYINPTVQMLIAVFVFGEHFTETHLITFLCIWAGLLIYSVDVPALVRRFRLGA